MNNLNYGENLRISRQTKGISQEAMALNLNISQASYSRIESEKIIPDRQQAAKIMDILGITAPDPFPLLEELDQKTMVSTRGSGSGPKASVVLSKPAAFIIKTGLAIALAGIAYDAASGFCSAWGTSANTELFARWIAALGMIVCFYYWVGGVERRLKNTEG